jgi:1-acyl-sn-glycerol-3-phosphate acyltransferase
MIKNIFGRVWAVWGVIVFTVTMFIFLLPFLALFLVQEPRRTYYFVFWSRLWMAVMLPLMGCPLRVKGKENFEKGKNYIVICNHNSLMDVPVTTPHIPGGNKTIAKVEMTRTPVFGLIYRLGSVLVDRKSEKSRRESYAKMKEVLNMGLHMCIYPEGTRNKSDQPIKAFHDGAFRLAIDTRKPIIPAIVFNTKKAMPVGKGFFLLPKRLKLHFLKPVPVEENETLTGLKEKLFRIMTDYYSTNSK